MSSEVTPLIRRLAAALADRYRIERELGQGGMATVYLAQDLKHDRRVAIKVLRPELAAVIGAERFLSEIKTTANLQHPHILPLHDSGRTGGQADGRTDDFVYYVMPFVEGESLRDRLHREKQLPIGDAVRIAKEVASALDYAHRHGVIHRDIKPENILLHDEQALVADFGIALAVSSAGGTRMTETGMSLGTPHYMSPEQAMGDRELTPRSDVYALGAMTYEMLLGEPPFTGPTAQSIVAKVMTERPAGLIARRDRIPPAVEDAVLTALEKLPADRWGSAAEFSGALSDDARTQGRKAARTTQAYRATARPPVRPSILLGALLIAVALAAWGWLRSRPTLPVTTTYIHFAPGEAPPPGSFGGDLARDGSALVYIGPIEGKTQRLWIKRRSELHATALAGTEGVSAPPFFSPDGRWIGFYADGKLKKVSAGGGGVVTLADAGTIYQWAGWLDDGHIVYAGPSFTLQMVSDAGGTPETVVGTDVIAGRGAVGVGPLPKGRGFLFSMCTNGCATSDVWVYDLKSRRSKQVLAGALAGAYLTTGHLLYSTGNGTLIAAPFDLGSLAVRGPGIPVLEGLARFSFWQVAGDGTLLYQQGQSANGARPVWVSRGGVATPIDSAWRADIGSLALSPDGRRLAVAISNGQESDIWVKELDQGPLSRLTFGKGVFSRPAWSSDGQSVLFVSGKIGGGQVEEKRADGAGRTRVLAATGKNIWSEASYSADGRWLILRTLNGDAGRDIYARGTGVDTTLRDLVVSPVEEYSPTLSPDGRWLAYVSVESGRPEVYVRPFPNASEGKYQISLHGGTEPAWAHSRKELFFIDGQNRLTAAEVTTAPGFAVGRQQALFQAGFYLRDISHSFYAVAPDDRRFLMLEFATFGSGDLVMVENWFDVLKAKLKQ